MDIFYSPNNNNKLNVNTHQAPVTDTRARFRNTLSTQQDWFDIWLRHFASSAAGIWTTEGEQKPAIPYTLKELPAFGFRLPVATGAVNSHTPRYDLLGKLDSPQDHLKKMMKDLGVAMLHFPYLSPHSALLTATRDGIPGLLTKLEACETAPYIETAGDWDTYWASRGKSRREWGRRERKLMNKDNVRFTCLRDWTEIAPIFHDILEIEATGWKGREGSAIIQNDETLGFYTELARHWAEDDMLRLFLLYEDDTPIAFELDAEYNGILHCFKHGYVESYAKSGPGQVLRMQVLRWAFANEAVCIFDMFGPDTEAKRKWATDAEELLTLRIFQPSPRGWLAWLRFSFAPRLKARFSTRTG